jgi:hypothetical protein
MLRLRDSAKALPQPERSRALFDQIGHYPGKCYEYGSILLLRETMLQATIFKLMGLGLMTLTLSSKAAQIPQPEKTAEKFISSVYQKLAQNPIPTISQRIIMFSGLFLGKPYALTALGEGPAGDYDQFPLYRCDAFDCETYVDTVLALALSHHFNQFKRRINELRYRHADVRFTQRNHFTDLDWNQNNQQQGFLKDITRSIYDKHQQPIFKQSRVLIDKPSWYQHMKPNVVRIARVNDMTRTKKLTELKEEGSKLPLTVSTLPYLPLTALFNKQGQANKEIFQQIPNAAIIEIVRPNWNLCKEIGTHLNVSHLGFAIWKDKTLFFRQASSTAGAVVDSPLIDYLRAARKSPTIKGINVQVVK